MSTSWSSASRTLGRSGASRSIAAGHGIEERGVGRDHQSGLSVAVLGLGHEVERDQLGIGRAVATTTSSLGPGHPVDPHGPDELALGLLDVRFPGPAITSTAAHGLGAEGQRRDRLGAAHPVHLGHPAEHAGGEDHRVGAARRGPGGAQTAISGTPAARAVTAPITTVDG